MIEITRVKQGEEAEFLRRIRRKTEVDTRAAQEIVDEILRNVRENGNRALFAYSEKFDGVKIDDQTIELGKDELSAIAARLPEEQYGVIVRAAERIRRFHESQKNKSWFETSPDGEILGQMLTPVDSVGVYVPGGRAALASTALMNIIPAKVAGVNKICVATPPAKDGGIAPSIAAAILAAGADKAYRMGGAQAIAALAYGTESVEKVTKIVGPGIIYVALAKKAVFGEVGIDSIAGPSEITVIADTAANPAFVAADMLSQAEHDEMAQAVLLTDSAELADDVRNELERQLTALARKSIAEESLLRNGVICLTESVEHAIKISNELAPEHLELCVAEPFSYLPLVRNAGAVFLGNWSPEPLGDYLAGPNHVLPTSGTAKFFSPLSVDDFMKKTSIISFSKAAFGKAAKDVSAFANMEGLAAHAYAADIRTEGNS